MADGYMGWTAENLASSILADVTHIGVAAGAEATISGELYKIDAYATANTTTIVKVFRIVGANYNYIGGESFVLSAGLNSNVPFVTPINVEAGDLLGFYDNTGGIDLALVALNSKRKVGNIVGDTAIADWLDYNYKFAIKGYIRPPSTFIPKIIII